LKIILFLIMVFSAGILWGSGDSQKLDDLDTLKELPVELVLDFYENEDVAGASMPVISKDGVIFFYDRKLRQLFRTHIKAQKLKSVGRVGDGPKEYGGGVMSMHITDEYLYALDGKGKLLCYDLKGNFKWEEPTGGMFSNIMAKRGDSFYFMNIGFFDGSGTGMGVIRWTKGKGKREVLQLPMQTGKGDAFVNGKLIKGGGTFFLSNPVFVVYGERVIGHAWNEYKFDIYDLEGKRKSTHRVDAPEPEANNYIKKFKASKEKAYAIMDAFVSEPYIVFISSYFKDEKPRVDYFTPEGKLVKSFILPFPVDSQLYFKHHSRVAAIAHNYLMVMDWKESGFRIYRIKSGL
jgi:hypothetical protein